MIIWIVFAIFAGIAIGIIMGIAAFLFVISMYGPFAEYELDNETLLPFGMRLRHFIFGRPGDRNE